MSGQACEKNDERSQSKLRRDLLITTATQVAVASTTFVQYGLIQRIWGMEALSNYSQLMRVRGVFEWIILLMIPVALTHELAFRSEPEQAPDRRVLMQTGWAISVVCLVVSLILLAAMPSVSAVVLFGSDSFSSWTWPFMAVLAGYSLCLVSIAIARGAMAFVSVNVIQVLYAVLIPIGIIVIGRKAELTVVVALIGLSALVIASLAFMRFMHAHAKPPSESMNMTRSMAAGLLLSYGVPRLLTMGAILVHTMYLPWFVSWRGDAVLLVVVNALLGIISATTVLVAPIGMIMLPHLSQLRARGLMVEAGSQVHRLIQATALMGGLCSLGALTMMHSILTVWLGATVADHKILLIGAAVAIPAFLLMEIVRNPNDAASSRPWNALSYLIGAIVGVGMVWGMVNCIDWPHETAVSIAMALGIWAAALPGVIIARRLYGRGVLDRNFGRMLGYWLGAASVLAITQLFAPQAWHFIIGATLTLGYIVLVARTAPQWFGEALPSPVAAVLEWLKK